MLKSKAPILLSIYSLRCASGAPPKILGAPVLPVEKVSHTP